MVSSVEAEAPVGVDTGDLNRLHDKLDTLWQKYLDHLDRYQKAQNQLQKDLSAGFFSLAQANYKSSNGRRYGSDFYDGRMKATRQCCVDEKSEGARIVSLNVAQSPDPKEARDDEKIAAINGTANTAVLTQQPSPPATPSADDSQPDDGNNAGIPTKREKGDMPSKDETTRPRDPLQWFGILTPRELRSSQKSFSAAMETSAIAAVNAAKVMRETEVEIRKLRKTLRKAEKALQE